MNAIASVEACSSDLGQIPAGAEIPSSPLGVGFKPTAGQHYRSGLDLLHFSMASRTDAGDGPIGLNKTNHASFVTDIDANTLGGSKHRVHQTGTATRGIDGQTAPEFEFTVQFERLALVTWDEPNAVTSQPHQCFKTAIDQQSRHLGIGAELGNTFHVGEEIITGVAPEVGHRDLIIGKLGHHLPEVVQSVVNDTNGAAREPAVATPFELGSPLEHQHTRTLFSRS